jgi:hypothetical protein
MSDAKNTYVETGNLLKYSDASETVLESWTLKSNKKNWPQAL